MIENRGRPLDTINEKKGAKKKTNLVKWEHMT